LSCDWSPSHTFIGAELDKNMTVSSANVASLHPSAVRASEVNKFYKVGAKTAPWGTPYGILQTDDLDLPTLARKVRPLRKECIIHAKKVLQPPWMSLWRNVSCQTESKAFSLSKRSIPLHWPRPFLFITCLTTLLSWWEVECPARKPNYWFGRTFWEETNVFRRFRMILSKTLLIELIRLLGR
jgi:hypothetical protein